MHSNSKNLKIKEVQDQAPLVKVVFKRAIDIQLKNEQIA